MNIFQSRRVVVKVGTSTLTYENGNVNLRNLEKQEVDFLITKDQRPYLMIESKASNENISKSLLEFANQLKPKYSFQSVFNMEYIGKDVFQLEKPMVIPMKTLLSQLL